jgi:hypothetical protein
VSCLNGIPDSESLLAGMEVIVVIVNPADVGISLPVNMLKYLGFHMMAAMQTI